MVSARQSASPRAVRVAGVSPPLTLPRSAVAVAYHTIPNADKVGGEPEDRIISGAPC